MVKRRSNLILPLIIAVAALGALVFWRSTPQPAPIQVASEPSPSPELILSGQSADGKVNLKISRKQGAETSTWTLTANREKEAAKRIWTATLANNIMVSIPLNTVSPDNKYLFLRQAETGKTNYLVLSTTGELLSPDSPAIEFAELFASKQPNYKITEVTGWAAPTLIVVNTDKITGGTGPSFWFDLASRSFIQLSNRFD